MLVPSHSAMVIFAACQLAWDWAHSMSCSIHARRDRGGRYAVQPAKISPQSLASQSSLSSALPQACLKRVLVQPGFAGLRFFHFCSPWVSAGFTALAAATLFFSMAMGTLGFLPPRTRRP